MSFNSLISLRSRSDVSRALCSSALRFYCSIRRSSRCVRITSALLETSLMLTSSRDTVPLASVSSVWSPRARSISASREALASLSKLVSLSISIFCLFVSASSEEIVASFLIFSLFRAARFECDQKNNTHHTDRQTTINTHDCRQVTVCQCTHACVRFPGHPKRRAGKEDSPFSSAQEHVYTHPIYIHMCTIGRTCSTSSLSLFVRSTSRDILSFAAVAVVSLSERICFSARSKSACPCSARISNSL